MAELINKLRSGFSGLQVNENNPKVTSADLDLLNRCLNQNQCVEYKYDEHPCRRLVNAQYDLEKTKTFITKCLYGTTSRQGAISGSDFLRHINDYIDPNARNDECVQHLDDTSYNVAIKNHIDALGRQIRDGQVPMPNRY